MFFLLSIYFTIKQYFFTIGLFFLGLSSLIASFSYLKERRFLFIGFINFSLFCIIGSTFYTLINIYDKLTRTLFAQENQLNSFVTRYYNSKKQLVKKPFIHGNDIKLGYEIIPNTSFRVLKKSESDSSQISFDVIYNINKYGNRKTKEYLTKSKKNILFLGDSTTFGVGLNDSETLPSHFSKKSSMNTINAALGGYGAHQVLKVLEDDQLFLRKSEGKKIDAVFYRLLPNHINRAAGYVTWDKFGPCYEVDQITGKLLYKGSLDFCKKNKLNIYQNLANILLKLGAKEPITSRAGKNLFERNYQKEIYNKKDYDRFLKIITSAKAFANKRNAEFYVIIQDLNRSFGSNNPCAIDSFARKIGDDLVNLNINILFTSNVHSVSKCKKGIYEIPFDGHPTSQNNKELANELVNWIKSINL